MLQGKKFSNSNFSLAPDKIELKKDITHFLDKKPDPNYIVQRNRLIGS